MVLATAGPSRVQGEHTSDGENVGEVERLLSLVTGGALAMYGLRRRGASGVGMALLGAELVRRGATGHCRVYGALGVNTTRTPRLALESGVTSRAATVNARRAVKVERAITIQRPASELYGYWRDFTNLPRFMKHLEFVSCSDEMRSHWVAKLARGKTVEWDAEIVNDLPNELIAWKTIGEPDVAHAGSVHFRETPGNGGTQVRIVFDYEPPGAATMSAIAKVFGLATDALVREDLRRFKQLMEAEETPSNL